MRGLAQGEQSTKTSPIIQLFCRSGGFLADLYSGSFYIEDMVDPAGPGREKVAATPFVAGTHKVDTGRYAILTGATTTWRVGTHRAVCSYTMESGGPTYTQSIQFEVLDPTDWATGTPYTGYISTRQVYQDGYATLATSRQKLHRWLHEICTRIERWTGRWFEPRFMQLTKAGTEMPNLMLQQPIIAIDNVYAVWQTTSGEDTYLFEQYLYKVYNRHLDGYLETDDRGHPQLVLTSVDGTIVKVSGFSWPYGNQNVRVGGVFGYTDPAFDPNNGRVLIGTTPADIARVSGALLTRLSGDPSMSSLTTWTPGSIREYRTRDQAIKFGGGGSMSSSGGGGGTAGEFSGDPLIDQILLRYSQPIAVGGV